MITFPKIKIDEKLLFEQAKQSFFRCVNNLYADSRDSYESHFEGYIVDDLKAKLSKISLLKSFSRKAFFFEVTLEAYAISEEEVGGEEHLAMYTLLFDDKFEAIDDYFR